MRTHLDEPFVDLDIKRQLLLELLGDALLRLRSYAESADSETLREASYLISNGFHNVPKALKNDQSLDQFSLNYFKLSFKNKLGDADPLNRLSGTICTKINSVIEGARANVQ